MANIWTKDNEYEDVTNIEQALWHLKVMRGGIRSCLYSPSTQQHMDEEDMKIERVQEQVLTVAIDYIKQNIMGPDAEPYEWISHKEYCERHHQKPSDMIKWYCPSCESVSNYRHNFCHHCGKRLNGDDEVNE